jgi:hypothetical protein
MQSNWTSCLRGQLAVSKPFGKALGIEDDEYVLSGGDMTRGGCVPKKLFSAASADHFKSATAEEPPIFSRLSSLLLEAVQGNVEQRRSKKYCNELGPWNSAF